MDTSGEVEIIFDEQKTKESISSYLNQVKHNPYYYSHHRMLVDETRKLYLHHKQLLIDLKDPSLKDAYEQRKSETYKRLRTARQSMTALFPLTPDMWISWINEEIEEDPAVDLDTLYQRAHKDYASVKLWLMHTEHVVKKGCPMTARNTFEEALTSCGLNYQDGHLLWNAFLKFEWNLFKEMVERDESEEQLATQITRVLKVHDRRLRVPSPHLESQYQETQEFVNQHFSATKLDLFESMENNLDKSKDKVAKIQKFEESLIENSDSLNEYLKYIAAETEPSRLVCLFERTVVDHCLQPIIWHHYLDYIEKTLRAEQLYVATYKRAMRNITWDPFLAVKLAIHYEKNNEPSSLIRETYEDTINSPTSTLSDAGICTVWKLYICYEWKCVFGLFGVYKLIDRALTHIESVLSNPLVILDFLKFWVELEEKEGNDEKVENIWLYAIEKYQYFCIWKKALKALRNRCNENTLRKLFKRAISEQIDGCYSRMKEKLLEDWLQFESVRGTPENRDKVLDRMRKQWTLNYLPESAIEEGPVRTLSAKKLLEMKEALFSPLPKIDRPLSPIIGLGSAAFPLPKTRKGRRPTLPQQQVVGPQMPSCLIGPQEPADEEIPKKKQKREIHERTPEKTVYVSNLASSTTKIELENLFEKVGTIVNITVHQSSRCVFAYVTYSTAEEAKNALKLEHSPMHGRPVFVSKYSPKKHSRPTARSYSQGLESNKLFVSNLSSDTENEDLEQLFEPYGVLKSVRLIKRKISGKSFAFVEFENEDSARKAFEGTNGHIIKGLAIQVQRSDPSKVQKKEETTEQQPTTSAARQLAFNPSLMVPIQARSRATPAPRLEVTETQTSSTVEHGSTIERPKLSNEQFRELLKKDDESIQ